MPTQIKHFAKYYVTRAKASLMQFAEYRTNMLMVMLGTYGYTLMIVVFIEVLFSKTQTVAGWSKFEMMLLFATGQFVFYLEWSFFDTLHGTFSDMVREGRLDSYLNKPINAFLNAATTKFGLIESVPSIALALTMFGYVVNKLDLTFSPLMLYAPVAVLISFGIMSCLQAIVSLAAFWLTDTKHISAIQGSLLSLNQFPLEVFPKGLQVLLLLFPIALLSYPQTKLLLESRLNIFLLLQPIMLVALAVIVRTMWKRGLRRYSSASS